ncbi:MAG: glycosyltransferase [Deltaproteobacteria bacterium]|nr:glycosyltransferase [Deltaproteobacteria bacterium]
MDISKSLAEIRSDFHLIMVGSGPYLHEMKVDLNGLPAIFTGFLEGDELAQAYASADIFIFPSTTDTFGNVVLEAQASGLPVIVSDEGGPKENLIPDKTGFIVPAKNPGALSEAVFKLMNNPQRLKKLRFAMIKPFENFNQLIALFSDLRCNRIPGQLVIQLTDRCNAFCPQCGMRVTKKFKRSTLSADNVKRIIDAAAQKGVNVVSFTGGEPFLFLDRLVMFIKYAGEAGIEYIRTGTNGFMFANHHSAHFESRVKKVAETLVSTLLRNFWISIDSAVPSVHEQMQGLPDVIAGIEKALPIFHEQGIYPSANLGINRNVGGDMTKGLRVNAIIEDDDYLGSFYIAFKKAFREFYCLLSNWDLQW